MNKTPVKFLAAIFLGAFAVRFLACVFLAGGLSEPPVPRTDAVEYDLLARNIVSGIGFRYGAEHPPSSFRPPLYPLFLAAVYKIFGPHYSVARFIQIVLSAAACVGIWFLAMSVSGGNRRASAAAAFLSVVHPSMAYHAGYLLTESLFIPLAVMTCLVFARMARCPSLANQALAGAALALLCLLRSNAVFLLPFIGVWLWILFSSLRRAAAVYAVIFVSFLAVLSPWVGRNYFHFRKVTFVSANGGMNFWGANNPLMLTERARLYGAWPGGIIYDVSFLPGSEDLGTQWIEKDFDQFRLEKRSWQLAWAYLRSRPGDIPRLLANKFSRFWSPDIRRDPGERLAFFLLDQGLIPFALTGLAAVFLRRQKAALILFFLFLAVQASALVFFADTRMRVGIAPAMVVMAGLGLDFIAGRFRKKEILPAGVQYAV